MCWATLALAGVAAAIYGPHVWQGGFVIDDWSNALAAEFPRTGSLIQDFWDEQHVRPGLALYIPATHFLLGASPALHIALAVAMAVSMSLALYAVLRRLSLTAFEAGMIALLVLLFPWASGARFWAVAGHISFAITLALGGILLTLRALDERAGGRARLALALRLGGLALYALSILTYDIAVLPLLLVAPLYLSRAPWKTVRMWWLVDGVVVCLSAVLVQLKLERERYPLTEMIDHAQVIGDDAATILAQAAFPFGYPFEPQSRTVILAALVIVVVLAIAIRYALRPGNPAARNLNRWVVVAGASVLLAATSWLLFVPSHSYYHPAQLGVGNRVNTLAAVGVVMAVFAALRLIGLLLAATGRVSMRSASAVTGILATILLLSYAYDTRDEQRAWARAATGADYVLAVIKKTVPAPPPSGSTIYTFGHAGGERGGIPIFGYSWDLDGAVGLMYDTPHLNAFPILQGTTIDCSAGGVAPSGLGLTPELNGARYGTAYFVDIASRSSTNIRSRAECLSQLDRFTPGPAIR